MWIASERTADQLGSEGRRESGDAQRPDDPGTDFRYRIGLVAGGFFTWPLGAHFDLQPEGLFSQQGAKLSDTTVDATIKIDSFVMPILVRYKLRPSGRGLVFFAGPSLGFKLSAKVTAEADGEKTNDDIGEDVESFDYGVVFGAGWEASRFSIDGRYTWGLSRLGVNEDESNKTTHRVIAVTGRRQILRQQASALSG